MMRKKYTILIGSFALFLFLFLPVSLATMGPEAFLTEQVKADYDTDGSIDTGTLYSQCHPGNNPCRYGYLEAGVQNTQDVLQYIRINISSVDYTNLSSKEAYKGALASSGSAWERNKLYLNSSGDTGGIGDKDRYYNITNKTKAPQLKLSFAYNNKAGGKEFYDEDNIEEFVPGSISNNSFSFSFTIKNPSNEQTLNNVNATIQFKKDTGSANEADVLHIADVSVGSTTGTVQTKSGEPSATNTDSGGNDDDKDKVTWSGNLSTTSSVTINMTAEIEELENLPDDTDSVNLDETDTGGSADWSDYSSSNVYLTGKSITDKFSRGPMRQGTDLANSSKVGWRVRGFFRNLGNSSVNDVLTYNVTEWALYNITTDGQLHTKVDSGIFSPSETVPDDGRGYTDWYTTGEHAEKPYFATELKWEVVWNSTTPDNYYAFINSTLNLPIIYKLDMLNTKTLDGVISPITSNEHLNITDTSKHYGSNQTKVERVEILSVVPGKNNNGDTPSAPNIYFDINEIENVTVYFNNGTGTDYEITSGYEVSFTDPTSDGDNGLVNVTIPDCSAVPTIGDYLNDTESIKIKYEVVTNVSMSSGDTFSFSGNSSMTTDTGTPLTEAHPIKNISVSGKRLTGYKDLIAYDPTKPSLINGSIHVSVTDEQGGGISGIRFMDYVPRGTDFDTSNVTVKYYDNSTGGGWTTWTEGSEYDITDNGTVDLPSGETAHAYEYVNASGDGWHFDDGDMLNVTYQTNITTSGLYEMPATLIGVDPLTGTQVGTTVLGSIKVSVPKPMKPLDIRERNLKLAERVTVGNPGKWEKKFEVFNPNSRPVDASFETKIFKDAEKAWITYTDREGNLQRIEGSFEEAGDSRILKWEDRVKALETRSYDVHVTTPPVLETDRDVKVLEKISNKRVKLKMDIYLRSFAKEKYEDVILNLPIPYKNVEEVRDGFGDKLKFTGGEESTTVMVGSMEEGTKAISLIYRQPYPTIIVTPEKDSYSLKSPVKLNVLVINGGQDIKYPKIETEIYAPGMQVVKSDIKELGKLEPLEKTKLSEKYQLSTDLPTGEYLANVRFREDFTTLASGTGKFYVKGAAAPGGRTIPFLILLVAIIIVSYISYKRLKEVREVE